jgi:hypothetical protein
MERRWAQGALFIMIRMMIIMIIMIPLLMMMMMMMIIIIRIMPKEGPTHNSVKFQLS